MYSRIHDAGNWKTQEKLVPKKNWRRELFPLAGKDQAWPKTPQFDTRKGKGHQEKTQNCKSLQKKPSKMDSGDPTCKPTLRTLGESDRERGREQIAFNRRRHKAG